MNASLWQLAGWTMIHSLWLGAAIALAGGFLRIAARRAAPNTRYAISLATLALLAATPIAAAGWLGANGVPQLAVNSTPILLPLPLGEGWGEGQNPLSTTPPSASVANPSLQGREIAGNPGRMPGLSGQVIDLAQATPTELEALAAQTQAPAPPIPHSPLPIAPPLPSAFPLQPSALSPLSPFIPHLPTLWLIGAPLTFTLLATGLVGSARLRRRATPLLAGPAHDACERLRQTLKITRRVALAVSDGVAQPILVGVLRPLILLPAAALAGWTPEQLDMVLLHELAHVRRRDNLVNLLQRIVESVLFFHPAVWIVSRQVRRDREECCDAAVIRHTNRPEAYATLLIDVASRSRLSPSLSPAHSLTVASAMASHPLAGRIRRILNIEEEPMRITRRTLAATLLLPALLAGAMLYSGAKAEDAQNPPPSKGGARGGINSDHSLPADPPSENASIPVTYPFAAASPVLLSKLAEVTGGHEITFRRVAGDPPHWAITINAPQRVHAQLKNLLAEAALYETTAQLPIKANNLPQLQNEIRNLEAILAKSQEELVNFEVYDQIVGPNGRDAAKLEAAIAKELDQDPTLHLYKQQLLELQTTLQEKTAKAKNPNAPEIKRLRATIQKIEADLESYRREAERSFRDILKKLPKTPEEIDAEREYKTRRKVAEENVAKYQQQLAAAKARLSKLGASPRAPAPQPAPLLDRLEQLRLAFDQQRPLFFKQPDEQLQKVLYDGANLPTVVDDHWHYLVKGLGNESGKSPIWFGWSRLGGKKYEIEVPAAAHEKLFRPLFNGLLPNGTDAQLDTWRAAVAALGEQDGPSSNDAERNKLADAERQARKTYFDGQLPKIETTAGRPNSANQVATASSASEMPDEELKQQLTDTRRRLENQLDELKKSSGKAIKPTQAEVELSAELQQRVKEWQAAHEARAKERDAGRPDSPTGSPNREIPALPPSADNAQPTADRDSLQALAQSEDEFKKVFEPRPDNPSQTINYSTEKIPQRDVSLYEDMFQGLRKDPNGPQLAFAYSLNANTKLMSITAPLEAHRKFFKPIFAGELPKAAHPPAPASTADESPTLSEFLKAFAVRADNPVVTREFHTAADRRSIDLLLHAIGGHPNAQNVELGWKWLDNGQLKLEAPEQAHAILRKDIPDDLLLYIQQRFPPFPTLENQKIADRAYKLLGLELEPLAPEELKRVKKLGYSGGLRVATHTIPSNPSQDAFEADDLLVGLHVWPITGLKSLDEVLQRDDLGELNPLKYYVIRKKVNEFDPSADVGDIAVTGRLQIPDAELLARGLEQTNQTMSQLAASTPAAGDLTPYANQAAANAPTSGGSDNAPPNSSTVVDIQGLKIVTSFPADANPEDLKAFKLKHEQDGFDVLLRPLPNAAGHEAIVAEHISFAQSSPQSTPPSPTKLKPGDSVLLKAVGAFPEAPLDGLYQLEAEGTLPLGPAYGRVAIADMTLLDAEQKIQAHLLPTLNDVVVQLTLQPAGRIGDFGAPSPIADKTFRQVSPDAPQAAATFLYDGKTFEQWRDLWKLELNPERRTEAINALAAFGRTGHGQEAADAILEVAGEYDAHYGDGSPEGELLLAILRAVGHMPAEQWMPQVQQRIIAAQEPEKSLWIRHAQHFLGASNDQSEDARRHAAKLGRIPSDHLVTSTALFLWRSDSNLDQPETVELLRRALQQKSPGISVVSLRFRHLDKVPEQLDHLVRDGGVRSDLNTKIANDKEMAARLYPPLLEMLKDPNRAEDRIGVLRALRVIGPVVRHHESLDNRKLITDELMKLLRTAPDELLPAAFVAYTKYWGSSNYDEILSSLLEQGQLPAERIKHLRDLESAIHEESNAP